MAHDVTWSKSTEAQNTMTSASQMHWAAVVQASWNLWWKKKVPSHHKISNIKMFVAILGFWTSVKQIKIPRSCSWLLSLAASSSFSTDTREPMVSPYGLICRLWARKKEKISQRFLWSYIVEAVQTNIIHDTPQAATWNKNHQEATKTCSDAFFTYLNTRIWGNNFQIGRSPNLQSKAYCLVLTLHWLRAASVPLPQCWFPVMPIQLFARFRHSLHLPWRSKRTLETEKPSWIRASSLNIREVMWSH